MNKTSRVIIYFSSWGLLTAVVTILNILNTDWDVTDTGSGVVVVLLLMILQGTVLEIPVQTVTTLILGGHKRIQNKENGNGFSIIINYNLLAHTKQDIEECFQCMYDAFMGNLSPKVSAVLVSATSSASLKEHEIYIRDFYRTLIYDALYTEGLALSRGDTRVIHPVRLENIWKNYQDMEPRNFVSEKLVKICDQFVNEFMLIHRTSRILKKCGQYQDLILLSDGKNTAYSYCDEEYYGRCARQRGDPLFVLSKDVENIHNRKFDFTLVADADTGISPGTIQELLEIGIAHPSRGIIQPAIKLNCPSPTDDTVFMHLESARHALYKPMENAINDLFDRCSFFGKGVIRNSLYIDTVIGREDNLIELVPIDILSHDTYEATVLNPLFVSHITFTEQPPLNYIAWNIRERRWNRGEILNAMYFWETLIGIPMRWLQQRFRGEEHVITKRRTVPKYSFISSFVAHSPLRQMLMKPLLLIFILIHVNVNLIYMWTPLIAVAFLIIVFPKFAVCNRKNFKFVFADVFMSIMQFTPEAIVGCVRIVRAFKANISAHVHWIPSREVETEFRMANPFLKSFVHLGGYSIVSVLIAIAVYFIRPDGILAYFMLATIFMLPIFSGFTAMRAVHFKTWHKQCTCKGNIRRYFNRHSATVAPQFNLETLRVPDLYTLPPMSAVTSATASSL